MDNNWSGLPLRQSAWTARAVATRSGLDFYPDRCGMVVDNGRLLEPAFAQLVAQQLVDELRGWRQTALAGHVDQWICLQHEGGKFALFANPRGSHGHVYLAMVDLGFSPQFDQLWKVREPGDWIAVAAKAQQEAIAKAAEIDRNPPALVVPVAGVNAMFAELHPEQVWALEREGGMSKTFLLGGRTYWNHGVWLD